MKIKHILKSGDFAAILDKGSRIKGKGFCLYVCEQEAGFKAIGVIIPKKSARLAVQRNHIRRLIYAVFREIAAKGTTSGKAVVVRLIQDISGRKRKELTSELREELEQLFIKAEV